MSSTEGKRNDGKSNWGCLINNVFLLSLKTTSLILHHSVNFYQYFFFLLENAQRRIKCIEHLIILHIKDMNSLIQIPPHQLRQKKKKTLLNIGL